MADTSDLRGLIRDSNVHAEVVDAVVECYRENHLDYIGAMNVLLGDSSISHEQNIQHTRREHVDRGSGLSLVTKEEKEADWKERKARILEVNPYAKIGGTPASVSTKPAVTTQTWTVRNPNRTRPLSSTLQSGEWFYPDDGNPPYKECLCGCGARITSKRARFKPGHDAKLKSVAKKVLGPPIGVPEEAAEFTEEQWHWLATQGYEPPEGVI